MMTHVTEKQEKINDIVVADYDRMIEEQKARFDEMLRFSMDSALSYRCTDTSAEDWQDTPEMMAKLIIELQAHAKAVANHL